jgi:hypothetical protein
MMRLQHFFKCRMSYVPIAHHNSTMNNRVLGRCWSATQPGFNRISDRASKRWSSERPHGNVADRTHTDLTYLTFTS